MAQSAPGAEERFRAGDYAGALAQYQTILRTQPDPDPRILYNAGNCEFRLGEFPRAAQYYHRALLRSPRDERARFNLRLTQQKLGMPANPEGFVDSAARFADSASARELLWAAAALETAGLAVLLFARRRRAGVAAAVLLLTCAAVPAGLLARKLWLREAREAIVVAAETKVFSEPREDLPVTLRLKSGEIVRVEESSDRWVKIVYGDRTGWTPRDAIGMID